MNKTIDNNKVNYTLIYQLVGRPILFVISVCGS